MRWILLALRELSVADVDNRDSEVPLRLPGIWSCDTDCKNVQSETDSSLYPAQRLYSTDRYFSLNFAGLKKDGKDCIDLQYQHVEKEENDGYQGSHRPDGARPPVSNHLRLPKLIKLSWNTLLLNTKVLCSSRIAQVIKLIRHILLWFVVLDSALWAPSEHHLRKFFWYKWKKETVSTSIRSWIVYQNPLRN